MATELELQEQYNHVPVVMEEEEEETQPQPESPYITPPTSQEQEEPIQPEVVEDEPKDMSGSIQVLMTFSVR